MRQRLFAGIAGLGLVLVGVIPAQAAEATSSHYSTTAQQPAASIQFDDQTGPVDDPGITPVQVDESTPVPPEDSVEPSTEADAQPIVPAQDAMDPLADVVLHMCPNNNASQTVPASANLGASSRYPDGPRSCTWSGKRPIRWTCSGGSGTPQMNIVNSEAGEGSRKAYNVACDGKPHTFDASKYPNGTRFHFHVHKQGATWSLSNARVA